MSFMDLIFDSERGKYIMVAMLLAIIVLGGTMGIYGLFYGHNKNTELGTPVHYKCQNAACGYEWLIDPDEVPGQPPEGSPDAGPAPAALDCPKCGTAHSCLKMIRCPNCRQWYVPECYIEILKADRVPSATTPLAQDTACPHCHTKFYEWYAEHR